MSRVCRARRKRKQMTLPIIGGIFALLLILQSLSRALRGRPGVTFLSFLLALFTVVPLSLFVIRSNQAEGLPVRVLLVAGMLLIAGIVIAIIERRRSKPSGNQSAGILAVGVSILLLASVFINPMIVDALAKSASASSGAAETTEVASAASVTPTEELETPETQTRQTATVFMTNTPLPTITPVPTADLPDVLPTRFIYTTLVPTVTVEVVAVCEGINGNNLNLRAEPSADGELLTTIPFSSTIVIYGRNADSTWLLTKFKNQDGWVKAEFVDLNSDCGDIPVQE
jgi:hypothetical protein